MEKYPLVIVQPVYRRPPSFKKKSGEESLLPIFSEGGGTSVHRLVIVHLEKTFSCVTTSEQYPAQRIL